MTALGDPATIAKQITGKAVVLGDDRPRLRQPSHWTERRAQVVPATTCSPSETTFRTRTVPFVNYGLIAANVTVFAVVAFLISDGADPKALTDQLALVPGLLVTNLAAAAPDLLTHMFMHGGLALHRRQHAVSSDLRRQRGGRSARALPPLYLLYGPRGAGSGGGEPVLDGSDDRRVGRHLGRARGVRRALPRSPITVDQSDPPLVARGVSSCRSLHGSSSPSSSSSTCGTPFNPQTRPAASLSWRTSAEHRSLVLCCCCSCASTSRSSTTGSSGVCRVDHRGR